ncbi:MFS transporter [Streptomyces sp. NPDC041068]|uniref:MFS transporter n=1 Tax=Streptomyces sp. NPDC041068 TaxID=3155130 RepID=UPI0033F5A511
MSGAARHRLLAGYRDLMELPGFWRIAALGMASKLPFGMLALSLLLLVGRDGAYGTAGLAVSALALGQGVTAPLRGRLIDRHVPRTVLLCCLVGHLASIALLVMAVYEGGPIPVVLALAAALGATTPPVAVMMRMVWLPLTDSRTLATAMALDSAMTGTALITGPVLASWLSLSLSAAAPLAVIAVLTTGVVALLGGSTSTRPGSGHASSGHRLGPLASAPLRRLLATHLLFVTAVAAVDVLLPIHAKEYGATAYTGLYLAALSIGSVLGSLALGAAPALLSRGPKVSVLLCAFVAGAGALAMATLFSPTVVLLVCPVAGLAIGCTFGAVRTLAGDLAPPGGGTETMSWLSGLDTAGAALGAVVFTQVAATEGSRTALLLVPMVAVLASVTGWRSPPPNRVGAQRRANSGACSGRMPTPPK